MASTKKYGIVIGLGLALLSSIAIPLINIDNNENIVNADICEHDGMHYSEYKATSTKSGIREYWVCCKCHEHYLSKPTEGKWTDGGIANITIDKNDDRYIMPVGKPDNDGFTYSSDGKTVTGFTPEKGQTEVTIPDGVTTIGEDAFKGLNKITTVTIPDSVTTIEEGAFSNCTSLEEIVIPSSVTTIELKAFYSDNVTSSLFGSDREPIVIYCECSRKDAVINFDNDWDLAYEESPLGLGLLWVEKVYANVYFAGEWHYDANGNPTPNK